ncbi:hypothetical protein K1719_016899 [Acacia pycnantha]|nr:hypothetical protein K1719_016899 [Acacia pycnantha]
MGPNSQGVEIGVCVSPYRQSGTVGLTCLVGPGRIFGYASDKRRFVCVAGGHSKDKNPLRSVFMYDVARMVGERDEYKAIRDVQSDWRIYCPERQGRFERIAEAFGIAT